MVLWFDIFKPPFSARGYMLCQLLGHRPMYLNHEYAGIWMETVVAYFRVFYGGWRRSQQLAWSSACQRFSRLALELKSFETQRKIDLLLHLTKQALVHKMHRPLQSLDRASWYIYVRKTNKVHVFSHWFIQIKLYSIFFFSHSYRASWYYRSFNPNVNFNIVF